MSKTIPTHLEHPGKFAEITQSMEDLRKVSVHVDINNEAEVTRCRELADKMYGLLIIDHEKGNVRDNVIGYGLSARQLKELDGKDSPSLTVICLPNDEKIGSVCYKMVNPQIIQQQGVWRYKGEGCLSFPGVYHNTRRYSSVVVGFVDLDTLMPREIGFVGFEAVVMQHEVEHQSGMLFLDKALIPVTAAAKIGANDPCPECTKLGVVKKWKKCLEHNVPTAPDVTVLKPGDLQKMKDRGEL